jgi:hypothetical protein
MATRKQHGGVCIGGGLFSDRTDKYVMKFKVRAKVDFTG